MVEETLGLIANAYQLPNILMRAIIVRFINYFRFNLIEVCSASIELFPNSHWPLVDTIAEALSF